MNIAPRELQDDGHKGFTQFDYLKDKIRDEHKEKGLAVTDQQILAEANERWPDYLQDIADANTAHEAARKVDPTDTKQAEEII